MGCAAALLVTACVSWRGSAPAMVRPPSRLVRAAAPFAAPPLLAAPRVPLTNARRARAPQLLTDSSKSVAAAEVDAEAQDAEFRSALVQIGLAVAAAIIFGTGVFVTRGGEDASAWFAAYVLEESLSIDNLFVFSLIFDYFQTPTYAQPRVLRWGLIAAVVLRALFIFAGLAVVERFKGVLLVFSGILLYSAYELLAEGDEEPEDLSQNAVVKLTKQYLPSTDSYDEDKFFTIQDGVSVATPLLLALVCVELSDVLFAVDSIPAVFGVTTDPFIAFSSNAFALLGLRALYTIIAAAVDDFVYLRPAIAVVLGFIGLKLIGSFAGYEIPTLDSLLLVLGTLGTGVGLSVLEATASDDDDDSTDA